MAQITINPQKLAEMINTLTAHKNGLISRNEELSQIKQRMDEAWRGDSQYEEVGGPALRHMIANNDEVVDLLNTTLEGLVSWLEAVKQLANKRKNGMM